jgi:anti-sigma B factor antagonist
VSDLARVESERDGDRCIVRIQGEIDISNAREVSRWVEAAAPNDAPTIVVDLSDVAYLDSAGVHLLFQLAERLRSRRQELRLIVPEDAPVRSLLEFTGLPMVIPVDDHADEG